MTGVRLEIKMNYYRWFSGLFIFLDSAIARMLPTDRRDLGLTRPDPDVTRWLTLSLILVLTFKDYPPPLSPPPIKGGGGRMNIKSLIGDQVLWHNLYLLVSYLLILTVRELLSPPKDEEHVIWEQSPVMVQLSGRSIDPHLSFPANPSANPTISASIILVEDSGKKNTINHSYTRCHCLTADCRFLCEEQLPYEGILLKFWLVYGQGPVSRISHQLNFLRDL